MSNLFDSSPGSKSGVSVDAIYIIVLFFGVAISLVTVTLFWGLTSNLNLFTGTTQGIVIRDRAQDYVNSFDYMLVMFYFGLHLGVIFMGWMLRSHPIFFIVSILFEILIFIISVPLSEAWTQFITDPLIAVAASAYPSTSYLMAHLPQMEAGWMIACCIFFYGFAKSGGIEG